MKSNKASEAAHALLDDLTKDGQEFTLADAYEVLYFDAMREGDRDGARAIMQSFREETGVLDVTRLEI